MMEVIRRRWYDIKKIIRRLADQPRLSWILRRDTAIEVSILPPILVNPQRCRVLRADDMVVLDVALHGLYVDAVPNGARLIPTAGEGFQ
jgi:hypothetical protein